MKSKHLFSIFVCILLLIFLVSCSGAEAPGYGKGDYSGGVEAPGSGLEGEMPDSPGEDGSGSNPEFNPVPGQITACAYNDNEHYDFWYGLSREQEVTKTSFYSFHTNYEFSTLNRIHIKVPKDVPTKVSLLNENNESVFTTFSDKTGNCYLYSSEKQDEYVIQLEYTNTDGEIVKETKIVTTETEFTYEGLNTAQNIIQLMFVIDATGSMGDEMAYIKAEVSDIISRISTANEGVVIELSILMYRDYGDNYVTRYSDFTQNISTQQAFLAEQSANGGGDFEEAVHTAMQEAASKQWRDNSTKILIHIADAPSHDKDVKDWDKATLELAEKGVRIITVASSGIDLKTEYFFRSQSMITNGHYVYLTNDSGIGSSHLEATVEERPTVEYLNSCLIRLIKGYHSGQMEEAIYYKQEQ